MKKIMKKILVILGLLGIILPMTLESMNTNVRADADSGAQTVVLTKFGFSKGNVPELSENGNKWTGDADNYKLLSGITFKIYDVTDAYNALSQTDKNSLREANKTSGLDTLKLITKSSTSLKTGTTGDDGTFSVKLDNNQKVYVFREVEDASGTYTRSKDLLLSLPQTTSDGVVYIYPKNVAEQSMDLSFKKIDSTNENQNLSGAEFVFSKKIGETTYYAKDLTTDVQWIASKDGATKYTSANDGLFTVNAQPFHTKKTGETTEYFGVKVGDKINFEETKAPEGYDVLKPGSFFVAAKGDTASTKINSKNTDSADNKLYLESKDSNIFTFADDPTGLLPHTGGKGIVLFIALGIVIIGLGCVLYKKRRA